MYEKAEMVRQQGRMKLHPVWREEVVIDRMTELINEVEEEVVKPRMWNECITEDKSKNGLKNNYI